MHTAHSHLEGQTRQCVGCTPPHSHLEGQMRWCVGCTPPCWPLEQRCRREGAQMPSSPPMVSPFSLLPPLPSPSYSFFCPPRSLGLHDVAFNSRRFCCVTWHRRLLLVVGDVAFDGGMKRRSLAVGDMPEVIRPHPSMRGGAVVAVCWTWGPSKGGDVAMVCDGDVVWLVGISVSDEHALT